MRIQLLFGTGVAALCLIALAVGQEGSTADGTGESGMRPPPPMRHPPNPLIVALDADKDGTISAAELANASTALATLDANGDGALTKDELRPPRPTPPADAQPGDHIMRLDADDSGGVTFEEFSAPLKEVFNDIDTSGNGEIDQDEAAAAPPPPPGPRHGHGPGGPPGDQDGARGGPGGPPPAGERPGRGGGRR